jgi:hypothetical protein
MICGLGLTAKKDLTKSNIRNTQNLEKNYDGREYKKIADNYR